MPHRIPEPIKRFLVHNIDSVAQWEGLLLLKSDPTEHWAAENLAQRLYINPADATLLLDRLVARGFIARSEGKGKAHYYYAPHFPEAGEKINQCAEYYAKHLVPVTHLIHSKTQNRIQKFADAFRLNKE